MPNTNKMVEADQFGKKLIESLAQSLNYDGTGREMRFTGGDVTPCLKANGVTIQDDHHWATEQAYKNGYENGKPKWISVKDRLPDDWVLCACVDNKVHILCYDYIMDDWDILGRPNSCYGKPFVTHWMPLPEAPKGE